MARYNLAARSLRHLRFARQVMVSQPLLARVSHTHQPTIAISFDGYHLPVGRILRRLPLNDSVWIADSVDSAADTAPVPDVASPAETWLRLLPRLPETDDANTTSGTPEVDVGAPPVTVSLSRQTNARHVADDTPLASATPSAVPPTRTDGLRPRSRIVELPGTVSLPVEEPSAEEPSAAGMPEESPEAAPVNASTESVTEVLVSSDGEPGQPPLMREADERITPTGREPAKIDTGEAPPVPPVTPAPTPRRRGKQPSATPPRASDALFPPTDADRSPATWLARLQHAEEPAPPTAPVIPGNEPPPSAPAQRPGARGSRKGATRAQVSTTATPDTHTTHTTHTTSGPSAAPPSPEPRSPEEQPSPLADSSRTLLHTLTGVDPASARVYRGPVAERAASAQNADALTDGGAIALGAGYATDTPETLGLLAHELTHIAQRRIPRFVSPVAISQTPQQQHRANVGPSSTMPQSSPPAASPEDEEAQARQVEARVTRVAREQTAPRHSMQPALPVESGAAIPPAPDVPSRPDTRPVWGNLPAPWEPLPEWMATPAESSVGGPQPAPQSSPSLPARAPSTNTPGTQRAERGRSLPAETEESAPAHTWETPAPEPDLDVLAQQVHAILKRRLAAERRRFG